MIWLKIEQTQLNACHSNDYSSNINKYKKIATGDKKKPAKTIKSK